MKQNKATIKSYFKTNDKPTESQFSELIDSYVDAKQETGEEDRRFVIDAKGEVSVTNKLAFPEYSFGSIVNNKLSLLKNEQTVNEIDLSGIVINDVIKKKEIIFTINDLDDNNTYEILSLSGENTFPVLHKVVFDIDITEGYDEFAQGTLFNLETDSGLLLHASPYININSLGRSMNISTVYNNVTFSNENLNETLYLKPNFKAINGALTVKVILFYSLVEF